MTSQQDAEAVTAAQTSEANAPEVPGSDGAHADGAHTPTAHNTPPSGVATGPATASGSAPRSLAERQPGQMSVKPLNDLRDTHYEIDFEGIAWVTFDREGASANTLGRRPAQELGRIVDHLKNSPEAKSVRGVAFLSAKPSSFISGADIREFDSFTSPNEVSEAVGQLTQVLDNLEGLKMPTVAAIHGYCLGGGLEFALACGFRLATRDEGTRVGFPEVKLGIFPGLNGTVRSIAAAGAVNAMDAMLTGRMIRASSARGMGLIDQLVDSRAALRWAARKAILRKMTSRGETRVQKAMRMGPVRGQIAKAMRKKTAAKVRKDHYPAPFALIDLFDKFGGNLKRMKIAETQAFAPLMVSDTARNLRRVFFLSEDMKAQAPKSDSGFQVRRVHVVGAGTMGADIAAHCVASGLEVSLQDLSQEALGKAKARAEKHFAKRYRDKAARTAASQRFLLDPEGKLVGRADVIIEAIVERLDVKQSVFKELEAKARPGAILASNTSSLPIEDIAAPLADPGRLIGLHFFNPVPQLPLVEVVKSPLAREDEITRGCGFVTAISKFPLVTKSTAGFLVNRVLAPYMMSAMSKFEAGDERDRIDAAAKHFGMPVGPLELADQVGLDICLSVAETLKLETGGEGSKLKQLIAAGNLGKKSGKGFYTWSDGKAQSGDTTFQSGELEALGRQLVEPLIAECEKCLAEGVVSSADMVDAGVIFGTGFAPFRGGPLHYKASLSMTAA